LYAVIQISGDLTAFNRVELVADFAEGVDKSRIVRVRLNFVPQCCYKAVNTAMAGKAVITPDGIQYLVASQSLAMFLQEKHKQLKLSQILI